MIDLDHLCFRTRTKIDFGENAFGVVQNKGYLYQNNGGFWDVSTFQSRFAVLTPPSLTSTPFITLIDLAFLFVLPFIR